MDTDGDGMLSHAELSEGLRKLTGKGTINLLTIRPGCLAAATAHLSVQQLLTSVGVDLLRCGSIDGSTAGTPTDIQQLAASSS